MDTASDSSGGVCAFETMVNEYHVVKVKRAPGPTIGAPQELVYHKHTCIMHIIVVSQDLIREKKWEIKQNRKGKESQGVTKISSPKVQGNLPFSFFKSPLAFLFCSLM